MIDLLLIIALAVLLVIAHKRIDGQEQLIKAAHDEMERANKTLRKALEIHTTALEMWEAIAAQPVVHE